MFTRRIKPQNLLLVGLILAFLKSATAVASGLVELNSYSPPAHLWVGIGKRQALTSKELSDMRDGIKDSFYALRKGYSYTNVNGSTATLQLLSVVDLGGANFKKLLKGVALNEVGPGNPVVLQAQMVAATGYLRNHFRIGAPCTHEKTFSRGAAPRI